jgi:hypothetical protein
MAWQFPQTGLLAQANEIKTVWFELALESSIADWQRSATVLGVTITRNSTKPVIHRTAKNAW